ncbi:multicopper oxidase [Dothidotthia symphoricarpi CBS 119687]|uniref:Multicopper oxidase n=1 Tax=Dothidotthia symphoricarpi CBS 119687 TaxID=1392245 RepID=A0A6A5ZYS0_9PLEO|nr:multicopper oxidase [Dothidotthia symphoricarpi CBS 119687]KAF2123461.1 multicopper oxidase [Dothidotthia symphoricarpi CBS 119687]
MHSIATLVGLVALLLPSATALSLPPYRRAQNTTHGPTSRDCWDGTHNIDTDMDITWPNTGKTVRYHLDVSNITMSPDGFAKPMLVFNGQYPGPPIVADWGDDLEITVTNSLEVNGTSIHWHGMRQLGSNEMDGVNGITECPIAPGDSKVYRFKATQYGTSWYHSHHSVQWGDGLVGPLIINGPATANYDIDLGALPFTDWFHAPIFTINAASLFAKGPTTADNFLINGSMTSTFGGKYAVTTLTPGKTHRLRLINSGINNFVHVALDGHDFTVIAADFIPIVPYKTSSIVIAVGQRYDVIIDAKAEVGNYWMRFGTGGDCDGPQANTGNIQSIFRYDGAPMVNPNSTAETALPTGCYDETEVVPYVKTTVPQNAPEELTLQFTSTAGSGNMVQWLINGTPMLIDYAHPTLQSVMQGNMTYGNRSHVLTVGEKDKWQYWVIQQGSNIGVGPPGLPHPIHLHGHDFYVLDAQANAVWSGDISRLKTDNPPRRDTATLPSQGYLVLAFESDNPGAWLMHCHIPFHVSAGLGVQFLERVDEIQSSIGSLAPMNQGCRNWKVWADSHSQDKLADGDSGLRRRW